MHYRLRNVFQIGGILLLVFSFFLFPGLASGQSSLQVVLHYVEGEPVSGKMAYQVNAYLSVLDGENQSVEGLTADNFSITEDSRRVEIDSVGMSAETEMNLVLVLDTSGSMRGMGIDSAKNAAQEFINQLNSGDQIAVMSFNDQLKREQEFTDVHQTAALAVNNIQAVTNAGTCLYDAAYEAVQAAGTLPAGRRAVILLTDGVDEVLSGEVCSVYTMEDVTRIASSGNTRVPIYTIGLGSKVDEKGLRRMAELTGGRYLFSSEPGKLSSLFSDLSGQLKSEYVLSYTSTSGPGAHTLVVSADVNGAIDQDSREFLLPDLPAMLTILSPANGQQVQDRVKISANLSGSGEKIEVVRFTANGEIIGEDATYPYEMDWDCGELTAGDVALVAEALDSSGNVITESSVVVEVTAAGQVQPTSPSPPTSQPTTLLQVTPTSEEEDDRQTVPILWIIGGAGLGIFLIAVIVFLVLKLRNGKPRPVPSPIPLMKPLATLTILQSDDLDQIGQVINLTQPTTTLGREADNEVVLTDKPVSRHHAIIEKRMDGFVLMEVVQIDSEGREKRPTYKTYVDDVEMGKESVPLEAGTEIKLGPRLAMRFEPVTVPKIERAESTMDDFDIRKLMADQKSSDRTQDNPIDEIAKDKSDKDYREHTMEDPIEDIEPQADRTLDDRIKGEHTIEDDFNGKR